MKSTSCICIIVTMLALVGLSSNWASADQINTPWTTVDKTPSDKERWYSTTHTALNEYLAALGGIPPNAGTAFLSTIGGPPQQGKRPSSSYIFIGLDPSQGLVAMSGDSGILPILTQATDSDVFLANSGIVVDTTLPDVADSSDNGVGSIDLIGINISNQQTPIGLGDISSSTVPAPGGIALLIGAFLCGRSRRRG